MDLPESEVHLWVQRLDVIPEEVARLGSLLSTDESERAMRFAFEHLRNRFTVARGRLRELLATYSGVSPDQIVFTYNSFGKPSLGGSELRFNLSHTGEIAVYAFAWSRDVGVDVEQIKPRVALERIPERFFSADEVGALRSLPVEMQTLGFFQCWTRKEAYVKARGAGLTIPLNSFDVSLGPGEQARFLRNGEGWSMRSFGGGQYVGAVVARGDYWELRWFGETAPWRSRL